MIAVIVLCVVVGLIVGHVIYHSLDR